MADETVNPNPMPTKGKQCTIKPNKFAENSRSDYSSAGQVMQVASSAIMAPQ
jgi:hypothetical protein